jgi:uncharacterized membrane protein YhaH (DUF805 family)
MGFGQAISTGFVKYVNFSDRACRSEFWYWTLFTVILSVVDNIINYQFHTNLPHLIVSLVLFLPNLAIYVRRLHDTNRSGWWLLICLIPLVGIIVLLVWAATKGTDGPNQYGPDPLADPLPSEQFGAPA